MSRIADQTLPHGGLRNFRFPQILEGDVTERVPHKGLKVDCVRQGDFDKRCVVHRVVPKPYSLQGYLAHKKPHTPRTL